MKAREQARTHQNSQAFLCFGDDDDPVKYDILL